MRVIHEFRYYNKVFLCGDLTVWDYYIYLQDQEYAIRKILTEFNDSIPNLNPDHIKRLILILMDIRPEDRISPKTSNPLRSDDFHIIIGIRCRHLKTDPTNIPLKIFIKVLSDLDLVIDWLKKYDPNRHKKTLDSKKLKEEFLNKKHST